MEDNIDYIIRRVPLQIRAILYILVYLFVNNYLVFREQIQPEFEYATITSPGFINTQRNEYL